eukprot:TRINITY_DN16655_c0_g1_i1.p1 TRINITY_DN16655_c0_g1~~TRINITY_DN16655_c0_g1_i1.p1  ORF type:complete len:56 (-),score=12.47 TRINITY_DN16655_c0_g1_i1:77-244(-)
MPHKISTMHKNRFRGNVVASLAITAFAAGIYAYTIARVSQNDFSDIDDKGNKKLE